ncbi:MAG: response regulator transcription factor [Gallionella sp.]
MRILLAEDDQMVGQSIFTALKIAHFTVDWAHDGVAVEHALGCEEYSLLLLDLGLPRKSGWEILESLRLRGDTLPVLILTARDALEDRIQGLNCGADDYLVKPFDLDELIARMRALLRRNLGQETMEITYGNVSMDTVKHEARLRGELINLSAKEFAILYALMEKPGAVLSRDKLEEKIYGWGDEIASNAIQVYIHYLRKKFGVDIIQNVRGVGYRVGLI